jgi:PAS domain-containing protein
MKDMPDNYVNSKKKDIMNHTDKNTEESILRQKALDVLGMNPLKYESQLSETDLMKLILELEVHQVELEMQNEELLLAKSATHEANDKYTELYDFAPSGYFTLSKQGEIIELNLRGANMLGKARVHLQNSQFGFFVTNNSRPIFNKFIDNLFNSKTERSCVVNLLTEGDLPIEVFLNGVLTKKGRHCLVTAVDVTEHMGLIDLKKKAAKLEMYNKVMEGRESKMMELKQEVNDLLKKYGEEEKYVID